MKKILLLAVAMCMQFAISYAQQTVSGNVVNANGEPVSYATIYEKGTSNSSVADAIGNFIISLSTPNPMLYIKAAGYTSATFGVERNGGNYELAKNAKSLDGVQIVGSRSATRTKMNSMAAVDVINIREVTSKNGQLDINQLLQYVAPSFNSNRQTGSDGADHIDPASLRGLGPDQTLVLLNGKRYHQSSLVNLYGSRGRGNNGTDLNTIPAAAIERIEILRDGAAAQYGSDAIAGVINIVLKTSTDNVTVNVADGFYTSKYSYYNNKMDGNNLNLSANYGFKLLVVCKLKQLHFLNNFLEFSCKKN